MLRTCTGCQKHKPATLEFFSRKRPARCRDCVNVWRRKHRTKSAKHMASSRAYTAAQWKKPDHRQRSREYKNRPENRERANALQRERRKRPKRKEVDRAQKRTPKYKLWQKAYDQKRYASENGRRYFKSYFERRKRDPDFRMKIRKYENERKLTDPAFALRVAVSSHLRYAFERYLGGAKQKNRRSWRALFNFTPEQLRAHLEDRFHEGMTWENRGRKASPSWEIDHIIPVAWWGISSTDDPNFRECWALANLQPMWARDNHSKRAFRTTINGISYTKVEWISAGRPMPPRLRFFVADHHQTEPQGDLAPQI